ncbi:cellulase N-terminal Ig-like domain-containing protein [Paenibacillus sp. FSL K6-0276]|uniref:cellulase N-terminal Ig-like domain-containing protein n=1 Tax=Paenibacillus sp. FSL K6-0276 TaxID=2921450 RepID=UPI0030ED2E9E
MSERTLRAITVNQIGYPVVGEKIAVFTGAGHHFQVVDVDHGNVVFEGLTGTSRLMRQAE